MQKNGSRSIPHSKTRDHHANETAEDYVEAVYDVLQENDECRVQDLVSHFDVSHVTVSRIVARLQKAGLLVTAPYRPIQLTRKGETLAKRVKKRHEVVYEFLRAIGVDKSTALIDSEGMEHHVSPRTLSAMQRYLQSQQARNR